MPKAVVPDVARVADKFVRRAGEATTDYTEGVDRSTKDQAANAVAARPLWEAQLANPATKDRWARNLARAGNEGFKRGVREKGGARYGPGVSASKGKYADRMGVILSTIAGVELPARGLPASESNFSRSKLIGQALNKLKTGAAR